MVINPIVGVYIPIIRIPIKGGMTIPNIATFDHGTHGWLIFMGFHVGKYTIPMDPMGLHKRGMEILEYRPSLCSTLRNIK